MFLFLLSLFILKPTLRTNCYKPSLVFFSIITLYFKARYSHTFIINLVLAFLGYLFILVGFIPIKELRFAIWLPFSAVGE